jgi:hypothetical protein
MDERRVGVERCGQLADTAAKDREDSGNVVARVGTSGQKEFNAGGETIGIARVCPNDIVEGGAGVFGVAAIGVGSVIEKPL